MAHRGAALHQAVLGALRAQLRGDPLARLPCRACHAQVREVQRAVLHLQAAAQLRLLHVRAVAHEHVLAALAAQVVLVALVPPLCVPFERGRRGGQRELHERVLPARPHHVQEAVHRGLARELPPVQLLDALDEAGVLLQAQHRDGPRGGQVPERPVRRREAGVGVGTAHGRLHDLGQTPRTADGEHRARGALSGVHVVHLQRHRGLAREQAPPPPLLQALVQRLVHRHDPLHAGAVGAVRLHRETHVPPPAARSRPHSEEQRGGGERERDEPRDRRERQASWRVRLSWRERLTRGRDTPQRGTEAAVEQPRKHRHAQQRGPHAEQSPEQ